MKRKMLGLKSLKSKTFMQSLSVMLLTVSEKKMFLEKSFDFHGNKSKTAVLKNARFVNNAF